MAKYRIRVCLTIYEVYEVEADSEKEARKKYWEEDLEPTSTDTKDVEVTAELVKEKNDGQQRA